jgi:hypothetical protein
MVAPTDSELLSAQKIQGQGIFLFDTASRPAL